MAPRCFLFIPNLWPGKVFRYFFYLVPRLALAISWIDFFPWILLCEEQKWLPPRSYSDTTAAGLKNASVYCQVLSFYVCYFCSFSYSTKGGNNDSCPAILKLMTPPPTLSWLWCCHVESPLLVLFGLYSGLGSVTSCVPLQKEFYFSQSPWAWLWTTSLAMCHQIFFSSMGLFKEPGTESGNIP